jgi:inosine/xanthosine triphosphatase
MSENTMQSPYFSGEDSQRTGLMPKIVIASKNPVKIQAALNGFQRVFPGQTFEIQSVSVPSAVSIQPMSDEETRQGALNRAANARREHPDADYWVGIEGGLDTHHGEVHVFAWIVVLTAERRSQSRTGTFALPDEVVALVQQGKELGEADDIVFGRSNSKQQSGSVGILTGDLIDRAAYYEHAVILALIPFLNPNLTFSQKY